MNDDFRGGMSRAEYLRRHRMQEPAEIDPEDAADIDELEREREFAEHEREPR